MPSFSQQSKDLLDKIDPKLKAVCYRVIQHIDFTVLPSTVRTIEEQAEFVRTGKSKTMQSKHLDGRAMDIAPWPIKWPDAEGITAEEARERAIRFYYLAGFVMGVAATLNIDLKFGGDWDGDEDFQEERFKDLPHFELK